MPNTTKAASREAAFFYVILKSVFSHANRLPVLTALHLL